MKNGKKSKLDSIKGDNQEKGRESVYELREELHGVIPKESFEFIDATNDTTVTWLQDQWKENVRKNKKYWRKHRSIRSCAGIGKNKVVIGIGSGPSFHKNKDVLKHHVNTDGVKPWEERRIITVAANHQYKPLLEMGIGPDFVLCVDGSDVVLDQLTKDIPPLGQNTIFIAGIHCDPKVIKTWSDQGRAIVFYTTPTIRDAFKQHMNRDAGKHMVEMGGNVLNGAFMIGAGVFQSTVFMGVGNDLSFPIKDSIDEQRESYYADKDYSTNAKETGTGRDEAKSDKVWAGFNLARKKVYLAGEPIGSIKRYDISLDLVGTSHTLWVYKTWLESTIMGQINNPVFLNYFNCSEGGILGVMAKDSAAEARDKPDNWYLLDEVAINKHTNRGMYHTAMLEDALEIFYRAKREVLCTSNSDAQYATVLEAENTMGDARIMHR